MMAFLASPALSRFAWLTHALMGLGIQALIAVPLMLLGVSAAWWIGAAASIGWWWSREKTQLEYEFKEAAHAPSLGPWWYRGFLPTEWDWSSRFQMLCPAAVNIAVAVALR